MEVKFEKLVAGLRLFHSTSAEEEDEPLLEVAHGVIDDIGTGGASMVIFGFGGFGIGREIDEGFAGEFFVLILAGGEFLIFRRDVVFVFEFKSFDFELEEDALALAVGEFLRESPVARHGRNCTPDEEKANRDRHNNHHAIKNKKVVLRPIDSLSQAGLKLGHIFIL